MEQLELFEPERKIGFRNRRHIRKDGKHVALAIPHTHHVTIMPGKYQFEIPYDCFDLPYSKYETWLNENGFEEKYPGGE